MEFFGIEKRRFFVAYPHSLLAWNPRGMENEDVLHPTPCGFRLRTTQEANIP